ncbi:ArsR/SmtB family transcription factor [Aquibacillus saliphilus]|uniref:ArsR/SmtB family transcription factor n=1 Tax=Aquibacillus saliphilus TaxID=1909422 RepID=UPI001CF07C4F|nr:metalloregulator ArsR/SmtB family transcription factor [Aquibacillus saliphilus]
MSATQIVLNQDQTFKTYEKKFKALSDEIRLKVMYELNQRGQVCVCDLSDIIELPQSKLSYHLKILLDVELIKREKIGTWNYYSVNEKAVKLLLSEELRCLFYPGK